MLLLLELTCDEFIVAILRTTSDGTYSRRVDLAPVSSVVEVDGGRSKEDVELSSLCFSLFLRSLYSRQLGPQ